MSELIAPEMEDSPVTEEDRQKVKYLLAPIVALKLKHAPFEEWKISLKLHGNGDVELGITGDRAFSHIVKARQ